MVFRFVDAPTAGTLLLTDLHTGPDGVVVSHGLFSTVLGAGTLSPGTEPGLQEVFANHSPVYLEVQVGAETLSPRVRIVSAGFAINAARLGRLRSRLLPRHLGERADEGRQPDVEHGPGRQRARGWRRRRGDERERGGRARHVHRRERDPLRGPREDLEHRRFGSLRRSRRDERQRVGRPGKERQHVRARRRSGPNLSVSGSTEGVRGQSTSPTGRGVVGGAFATTGDARGVYGESQSSDGTGVYGRATPATGSTTGVGGDCFSTLGTGVAGVANATSGDAWGVYGATLSAVGFGVVSEGDSGTVGDIYATGTKFFITEHPQEPDKAIRYACLEGGEVGVYHRGVARLSHGEARIALPDHFPMVASGNLTVHLTPLEDCDGLYVAGDGLSSEGFTVHERAGGKSDASFSYLVVADRRGFEDLSVVTPVTLGQKVLMSPRFTHAQKAALRAALGRAEGPAFTAEDRTRLFASLEAGDFVASCRSLGGCPRLGAEPAAAALDWKGERPSVAVLAQEGGAVRSGDRAAAASGSPAAAGTRAASGSAAEPLAREAGPRDGPGGITLATLDPDVRGLEHHAVAESVDAGDVLVVDPTASGSLRRAATAADRRVVGVAARGEETGASRVPVVLSGTALCKVDADYGPVAAGDLLTASPTPGHAMRAAEAAPGTIVGKALESLDAGRGMIRIVVMLR